jgi:hypothetical protein
LPWLADGRPARQVRCARLVGYVVDAIKSIRKGTYYLLVILLTIKSRIAGF